MGEAGGSSESEFSNERSSTNALRPRIDRGSAARLDKKEAGVKKCVFIIIQLLNCLVYEIPKNRAQS